MNGTTIVIGLGEVGKPLSELLSEKYDVLNVDIEPVAFNGKCDVMHICFPFQVKNFVEKCAGYIHKYQPRLTVINSTVAPGTTRCIYEQAQRPIAYSPVRGKHMRMKAEMIRYTKFIGGINQEASMAARRHFERIGMKTRILPSPEAAELAKLTETTYFGLLIMWAQEVERYCDQLSLNYEDVIPFYEEINYLPQVRYTPGVIGGHCVMPNIAILQEIFQSDLLDAIEKSNELKKHQEAVKNPAV